MGRPTIRYTQVSRCLAHLNTKRPEDLWALNKAWQITTGTIQLGHPDLWYSPADIFYREGGGDVWETMSTCWHVLETKLHTSHEMVEGFFVSRPATPFLIASTLKSPEDFKQFLPYPENAYTWHSLGEATANVMWQNPGRIRRIVWRWGRAQAKQLQSNDQLSWVERRLGPKIGATVEVRAISNKGHCDLLLLWPLQLQEAVKIRSLRGSFKG